MERVIGVAGSLCPKCNTKIFKGQKVVTTTDGIYEHETCLTIVSRTDEPSRTNERADLKVVPKE